jgi:hypothetical protein
MSIQSVPTAAGRTVVAAEQWAPGVSPVSMTGIAAAVATAATMDMGTSVTADTRAAADFAALTTQAVLNTRVAAAELWATAEVPALRLAAVLAARSAGRAPCSALAAVVE